VTTSPEAVADLILNAMPEAPRSADDAEYVPRFADLMRLVERAGMLPIAYADYFDHDKGWRSAGAAVSGALTRLYRPAVTADLVDSQSACGADRDNGRGYGTAI